MSLSWVLLLFSSARQAGALPSSLWWICLMPEKWCNSTYLFFFLACWDPVFLGYVMAAAQHPSSIISANCCCSICVCVYKPKLLMGFSDLWGMCPYMLKFWNMTSSSYASHVLGSLNCFAKGKQNWLCFHILFTAKFSRNVWGQEEERQSTSHLNLEILAKKPLSIIRK